eukprot:CAMPEP_0201475628 /NCGR_PEP_ID=MMETSP0151_2-20130828/1012_1 /ASSEMBLY_ACC=CAM_ASM_000257 /TAXON_ID=200890 /ORGANISM="Paramoeba atlantica, Strain 621/1 / CCAP 1560/9" /LENGTH=265 /DNA_ID=CAMNT_0047855767 /DNA_START=64 /DNA_END=858 /DNA_ORIENTATION=+
MSCLFFFFGKANDSDDEDDSGGSSGTPLSLGPSGPGSTNWKEDEWRDTVKNIWNREIGQLPVHTDIPRLGSRMKVFDGEGKLTMEDIPEDTPRAELVQRLLSSVAGALNDEESLEVVKSKYYEYIDEGGKGDISQQLLKLLVEHFPKSGKTIKILKACHQKIVFPGFYHIKSKFFEQLPFKDMRGTWTMSIHLLENHYEVRHRKTQIAQPAKGASVDDPGGEFNFEWELRMDFDSNMKELLEVDVSILSIAYRDDVSEQRKGQIE